MYGIVTYIWLICMVLMEVNIPCMDAMAYMFPFGFADCYSINLGQHSMVPPTPHNKQRPTWFHPKIQKKPGPPCKETGTGIIQEFLSKKKPGISFHWEVNK